MTTITKLNFSEAENGLPISVEANASPGTLIHAVTDTSEAYEEVWLYATNIGNSTVALTLVESDSVDTHEYRVGLNRGEGFYLVLPGMVYRDGVIISAYVPSGREGDVLIKGQINQVELA